PNRISVMSSGGNPAARKRNRMSDHRSAFANAAARYQGGGLPQTADLFLGHHALDVLGLALDAVARAPVGLDRQAADDGIDAALGGGGAALRSLNLMMDIVVNSVNMGHLYSPPITGAF